MSALDAATRAAFAGAKAHVRRIWKGTEISPIMLSSGLAAARIVVIAPVCNEGHRLDFFLRHYRAIGVDQFIFIGNLSKDDTVQRLARQADVSIFEARGAYARSRYAVDWVNYILSKYCVGKWILHLDADEILVFPHQDSARLPELCGYLEGQGLHSLNAMLIDMYSGKPISENHCRSGQDPLEVCPLFDADGYESHFDAVSRTTWIKGGVRGRVYFSDDRWSGPALNKTPLVLWKRHYAFLKSAHEIWPWKLNEGARKGPVPLTAALLHFKFLASFTASIAAEAIRQQHTREYAAYVKDADRSTLLLGRPTASYTSARSLLDASLMTGEGWISQFERAA